MLFVVKKLRLLLSPLWLILLASQIIAIQQGIDGITLFSEEMTNFVATENFSFTVQFQESHKLVFLLDSHHSHFRGFFFVETTPEQGSGQGLTVQVEAKGQIMKTFSGQKIGVFNFEKPSDSMISLTFKAEVTRVRVTLNYELKKQETIPQTISELKEAIQRYDRVFSVTEEQLKMIVNQVQWTSKAVQSISEEISAMKRRIIWETLAIVISGFICMLVITRKLRDGYQLV